LTQELQSQSVELRQTNEELQEKAALLSQQNRDIEVKNREIELARLGLEEKAEQLSLSSSYKSEFLANMSHELRTPLNSLLILSDLLAANEDGNLSQPQVEFAQTIHSAGSDLLALINDILDLSKVEAGRMDMNPATVVLESVRDGFERSFRPVAEQRGLDFRIELAEGLPAALTTDEQRLAQILGNLLSNAFKFTEQGGVTLRIEPLQEGEQPTSPTLAAADGVIVFSVADTGIGISETKLTGIFEAFQQADGTTSRSYGGTGLGLSISREIASLLGGEIRVQSTVGQGSCFTLYLPATIEPPALAAPPEAEHRDPPARAFPVQADGAEPADTSDVRLDGKTILIVDDDVRNVFALTSLLEPRGARVLFAENGRRGIEALEHNPEVDLVLMDVMMPEMDGHETTRAVRTMPAFRALPIIALTAKAMTGDRDKSIAAGASDYITKPVDVDRLLGLMRAWLDV
jgi:signal transduction histidine kinase/CheY-like chemotaxis protein